MGRVLKSSSRSDRSTWPNKVGYYWATLRNPTGERGEDWVTGDPEIVQISDNNGEGDEAFSVQVFGVPITQWQGDLEWGRPVADTGLAPKLIKAARDLLGGLTCFGKDKLPDYLIDQADQLRNLLTSEQCAENANCPDKEPAPSGDVFDDFTTDAARKRVDELLAFLNRYRTVNDNDTQAWMRALNTALTSADTVREECKIVVKLKEHHFEMINQWGRDSGEAGAAYVALQIAEHGGYPAPPLSKEGKS